MASEINLSIKPENEPVSQNRKARIEVYRRSQSCTNQGCHF